MDNSVVNFNFLVLILFFRLLAQVYTLCVEGDEQHWEKLVDEVVRISVICEQESPKCIYRVTAGDADLQGIIEAYITVPGRKYVFVV